MAFDMADASRWCLTVITLPSVNRLLNDSSCFTAYAACAFDGKCVCVCVCFFPPSGKESIAHTVHRKDQTPSPLTKIVCTSRRTRR